MKHRIGKAHIKNANISTGRPANRVQFPLRIPGAFIWIFCDITI